MTEHWVFAVVVAALCDAGKPALLRTCPKIVNPLAALKPQSHGLQDADAACLPIKHPHPGCYLWRPVRHHCSGLQHLLSQGQAGFSAGCPPPILSGLRYSSVEWPGCTKHLPAMLFGASDSDMCMQDKQVARSGPWLQVIWFAWEWVPNHLFYPMLTQLSDRIGWFPNPQDIVWTYTVVAATLFGTAAGVTQHILGSPGAPDCWSHLLP